MRKIPVLDSHLSYRESGAGSPVVFLHGNPVSSHIWRHVTPHVSPLARCLAPDLIGMGLSGRPDIAYRFRDHSRYLDAWFDALNLRDAILVGYDWGGALAMDWAARHPGKVRGLVVFETFLRPMHWSDWPEQGRKLFQALRTAGAGEKRVLEENEFLARSLANGVRTDLAAEDRAVYYSPYTTPESRRPLLQWTREIPIDGEPADVVAAVERYGEWLCTSPDTPKLLMTVDTPSPLAAPRIISWARASVTALEVLNIGAAGHHAPEDAPHEIGAAIAAWMERQGMRT